MGSLNFVCHIASMIWIVSISDQCIFSVKYELTISLWQSLRCSLSSFVFPIPAPDPFPFVIETKRAQLIESSSNTDRNIFSAFGSSSSLRVCTSDRPSSWGQWMVLKHDLVLTGQKLFAIHLYITIKLSLMTNSRPPLLPAKFWTLFCSVHIHCILTISNTFNFTITYRPSKKEKAEIFITLLEVAGFCFCYLLSAICYLLPEVKTIRHYYIREALLHTF